VLAQRESVDSVHIDLSAIAIVRLFLLIGIVKKNGISRKLVL
jgi:hypothetical protein